MNNIPESEVIDVTGKIGSLHDKDSEWPMYSFDSPSYFFWQGVAQGLQEQGATEEEIQWWLQSKCSRWTLDGMGQRIHRMGNEIGNSLNIDEIRAFKDD